jgi:hypothetical protein
MTIKLILDSGAFTAWTKRVKIDIDKYIDFALKHQSKLTHIANLDVIPGTFGQKVLSVQDIEQSAAKGWSNYQYMLKKGVSKDKLMHIFHQGENFKWLHKLMNSRPTYIGLSPANDRVSTVRAEWLKKCMNVVCDKEGKPLVKFHGYAATSFKLMKRFPWSSVDSASWRILAGYGKIYVPQVITNKEFNWSSLPINVSISNREKKRKEDPRISSFFEVPVLQTDTQSFDLQPVEWQKIVKKTIRNCGFDFEKMCDNYKERTAWNAFYFLKIQKEMENIIVLAAADSYTIPCIEKAISKANPKTSSILFSYYYLLQNSGQTKAWKHYLQLLS